MKKLNLESADSPGEALSRSELRDILSGSGGSGSGSKGSGSKGSGW